jgi:hypothetical protein
MQLSYIYWLNLQFSRSDVSTNGWKSSNKLHQTVWCAAAAHTMINTLIGNK